MKDAQGEATGDQSAPTEDGDEQIPLTRELSSALTAMKGRTQLLRRRLRQGDDTARLETDLEAIETELTRLTTLVERIHRGKGSG
jgi:nitrogen-specific signal transduction histidine kinase